VKDLLEALEPGIGSGAFGELEELGQRTKHLGPHVAVARLIARAAPPPRHPTLRAARAQHPGVSAGGRGAGGS
jgi:hypothetical protein